MIYDFDIAKLIRRYVPVALRHPINLQWAYVLCSWLARIHSEFLAWRQDTIIAEYRYNGLIHSLEWMLNDRFDTLDRRIYITVVDQIPVYYHQDQADPTAAVLMDEGQMSGYYHLDQGAAVANYDYEFLVHVPVSLSFDDELMFQLLDLYRYAGRRPAIRLFDALDQTVDIILYPGLELPANAPTPIGPNNLPNA